jgi:hypothetical protein
MQEQDYGPALALGPLGRKVHLVSIALALEAEGAVQEAGLLPGVEERKQEDG